MPSMFVPVIVPVLVIVVAPEARLLAVIPVLPVTAAVLMVRSVPLLRAKIPSFDVPVTVPVLVMLVAPRAGVVGTNTISATRYGGGIIIGKS